MRFGGQRGRMISASDRSKAIELIKEAVINGASETSMQGTRDQSEDATELEKWFNTTGISTSIYRAKRS